MTVSVVMVLVSVARFWSLLQPWLPVTPTSVLPLVTSFGRGCGKFLAIDGQVRMCMHVSINAVS